MRIARLLPFALVLFVAACGELPRSSEPPKPAAPQITEDMKMAAARAIAQIVADHELREEYIIPSAFNRDVAPAVAEAVAREARRSGWAQADDDTFGYAHGDTGEFRAVHD